MKSKKGMSIPIVLLVLLTVVLALTALSSFATKDKNEKDALVVTNSIDKLYVEENSLNYHLRQIFSKVTNNFAYEGGIDDFIDSYKIEMENYKNNESKYVINWMWLVEDQINDDNVELNRDKLVLKLNISIGSDILQGDKNIAVKHSYKIYFVKILEGEDSGKVEVYDEETYEDEELEDAGTGGEMIEPEKENEVRIAENGDFLDEKDV